jgi:hypothetical protein
MMTESRESGKTTPVHKKSGGVDSVAGNQESRRSMPTEHQYTRVIQHHGRTYFATTTMSDIFIAHAHDIAERGDTELVPLLHKGGVDLLLVGPLTRFAVADIEVGSALDAAAAAVPESTAMTVPVRSAKRPSPRSRRIAG